MTASPLVWLPDAVDRLEHAVTDHDVVRAGSAGQGHVVAVCSASVLLCSLATPPLDRCPDCQEVFARDRVDAAPRRRRPSWTDRLFRRGRRMSG